MPSASCGATRTSFCYRKAQGTANLEKNSRSHRTTIFIWRKGEQDDRAFRKRREHMTRIIEFGGSKYPGPQRAPKLK